MNNLEREVSKCRVQIHEILSGLGIKQGDVIYLGVNIGALPLPKYQVQLRKESIREREQFWCSFLLESLQNYLGPKGTILAPAFTYSCSRPGSVFINEESPSEVGPFTDFLRAHEDSIRSVHPMFSVCGIGPLAVDILNNCGSASFGALSPFERMNNYNCKFLCLGTRISHSLTYVHHLEQTYGCNHRFNKIFNTTVMQNGKVLPGPWLSYLAYRSIEPQMQCVSIENELLKSDVLVEYNWNDQPNQCVQINDVNRIGYRMLRENPCAFMTDFIEVVLEEDEGMKKPVETPLATFDLIPRTT